MNFTAGKGRPMALKKKIKKVNALTVNQIIYKRPDCNGRYENITVKEMNDFVDDFIDLVEKRKWSTGGGFELKLKEEI